jgi:hypothetical protein
MRTIAEAIAGTNVPMPAGCNSLGRVLADLTSHQCHFPLHGSGVGTRFCAVEVAPHDWQPGKTGGCYCRFHRQLSQGCGTESERSAVRLLKKYGGAR